MKVVLAYMGHAGVSSTEFYTRVFTLDVGYQREFRFTVPVSIPAAADYLRAAARPFFWRALATPQRSILGSAIACSMKDLLASVLQLN